MANTRDYSERALVTHAPQARRPEDFAADYLLDVVASVSTHALDRAHVDAICTLLADTTDKLQIAQGVAAAARRELLASRDAHQVTALELDAEQAVSSRLRQHNAEISGQLAELGHLSIRFQQATLRITGRGFSELTAEWAAEDAIESRQLELKQIRADRVSRVAAAYHVDDPSKLVVDLECLDEPSVSRTVTPRVVVIAMAEMVGGGR